MNSGESRGKEFIEIRCNKDNTLLFRALHVGSGEIEIKCRRCGDKRRIMFPINEKAEHRRTVGDSYQAKTRVNF